MYLPFPVRNTAAVLFAAAMVPMAAAAEDFVFSAKVDKTTASVGEPIQLTFTLSGDSAQASIPPLQLPEGFVVMAQSRSTNFAIHAGAMEHSTSLVYVLVAQKAGTFRLGPFTITRKKQTMATEPIELTIKPPVPLPLQSRPNVERYTL